MELMEQLKQIAAGIAAQFGSDCEVAIHDLRRDPECSIVAIENGHVTGRKVGDGASRIVLEQLQSRSAAPQDALCYLTETPDGKVLKSSTLYIRDGSGAVVAILSINYDISRLLMFEDSLRKLLAIDQPRKEKPEKIVSVHDLLDDLIRQSVALVGKPASMMNKEEKVTAIQFLNDHGAFLITKSGDKVSKYFGISKYTLYAYIDDAKQRGEAPTESSSSQEVNEHD